MPPPPSPERRQAELEQLRRSVVMVPDGQLALTKAGALALIEELSHLYKLQQDRAARPT